MTDDYIRVTGTYPWQAELTLIARPNKNLNTIRIVAPAMALWLTTEHAAHRAHVTVQSFDYDWSRTSATGTFSLLLRITDDPSFAVLFKMRWADEYDVRSGIEAVFSRRGYKTVLVVSPPVKSGSGEAAQWCAAVETVYRGFAFHRDNSAYRGAQAPLVQAVKHWFEVNRPRALEIGAWSAFAVLLDGAADVTAFIAAWGHTIVSYSFMTDDYVDQALANFERLKPFVNDQEAKWRLQEANQRAARR